MTTIEEVLNAHRSAYVSADWDGSPDPSDWHYQRLMCRCGAPLDTAGLPLNKTLAEQQALREHQAAMVGQALWEALMLSVFFIPSQYEEDGLIYAEQVRETLGGVSAHGQPCHRFDLRCEACHEVVSKQMDADFIESMTKEGLTPEQAQEMLTEARRIGQELREAKEATNG